MDQIWVLVPLMAFAAVAWVIRVIVDGFQRRHQLRVANEFHSKLLDRIGSAREFGEFINSPGGTRFLDSLKVQQEAGTGGAPIRILRALQSGLVLLAFGVGLFLIASGQTLTEPETRQVMAVFATIATSVGIGLLVSAGASYAVSKRLGLLNHERGRDNSVDLVHTA